MLTRKHTAWKKNRKFGDVFGGRTFPKCVDKVFNQQHSLSPLCDNQKRPVFITDNPSKDFYFPVTIEDIKAILDQLPAEHTCHITHIWLQRIKKTEYENGDTFQGCFICGSGVYLVVLHPFPIDNKMCFGQTKPSRKVLNYYKGYTTDLHCENKIWFLQWTDETIRRYYLESLLLHEIGHSIDSFYKRYWSKATATKRENFANNYVALWTNSIRESYKTN